MEFKGANPYVFPSASPSVSVPLSISCPICLSLGVVLYGEGGDPPPVVSVKYINGYSIDSSHVDTRPAQKTHSELPALLIILYTAPSKALTADFKFHKNEHMSAALREAVDLKSTKA